jgi:DDE superfamily endonuclease
MVHHRDILEHDEFRIEVLDEADNKPARAPARLAAWTISACEIVVGALGRRDQEVHITRTVKQFRSGLFRQSGRDDIACRRREIVLVGPRCNIPLTDGANHLHAVWLYYWFPLSFRDVEDMRAERGIDVSYETVVRRWSVKFGLSYARRLRRSHPPADKRWHLDEMSVSINGKAMYLWRAVDCEGEVLDVLVQSRRNKKAALKLMRKLLKAQGFAPTAVVTDKLPS